MKKLYYVALPLALLTGPALAEPTCKTPAAATPMWQVAKSFEETGGTINAMKTTNGCYEIYGHQKDRRVEVFYDPATGSEIERE